MTVVDYTHLFERIPNLGLDFDRPGALMAWQIRDRNTGRLYTRAVTLDSAIQFIRAAVRLGDATADEESIEFFRMQRASIEHSWRVAQDATSHDRLANVYRIRPHEQIDEPAGAA